MGFEESIGGWMKGQTLGFLLTGFFLSRGASGFSIEAKVRDPAENFPRSVDELLNKLGEPIALYGDWVKVKFEGEFRYRFELRDDFNFEPAWIFTSFMPCCNPLGSIFRSPPK